MPKKITHEEFIEKLKLIKPHLEILSEYKGNKKYITVRCTIHDHTWNSKPNWLMHDGKYDCQKCYDERRGNTIRTGLNEFVTNSNKQHGNKYNYDKVVYANNKTKIIITCPIHGDFITTPEKHLNRHQGCPKCGNRNVTTEEFIEKAKKIHGDKYDYSKSIYIDSVNKVCIICPKHGEFWQTVDSHLYSKCGCPVCKSSKLEILVNGILKNNNFNFIFQYKPKWLGKQSLDFYLPDHNIAIECQGEQHFNSVKHFGGNKRFNIDTKRDMTKNELCKENDVNLIYVTNNIDLLDEILVNPIFLGIYNKDNTICAFDNEIEKILLQKLNK